MAKTLTTQQAAEILGISTIRVRQLIGAGRLPAEKFGRDYMIKEEDLELVADRTPGRPPKAKAETVSKASKKKRGKK
ncbi:MAG: Helix-turn-helix domain [Pyrinomonadaceae bacterium]|nr:Helix-turn-helix domain [Pyrinomonadaceae bacterium]MDX6272166.1 Helix-turn-helix domain [Acidobacteriota bacterium]